MTPDLRLLILPLPEFALLPFGAFLDKLRFSADDEDYSRQRYCRWTVLGLDREPVVSSSAAIVQVEATPAQIRWGDYDHLVLFGGRNASATAALAPRYKALLKQASKAGVKLVCVDNAAFLLAACGLLERHPQAGGLAVGIWGRKVERSTVLRDQDRVELYRPLLCDPKEARRQRYRKLSGTAPRSPPGRA